MESDIGASSSVAMLLTKRVHHIYTKLIRLDYPLRLLLCIAAGHGLRGTNSVTNHNFTSPLR